MSIFLFVFFFFLQKGLIRYAQYISLILVAKIHQVIFLKSISIVYLIVNAILSKFLSLVFTVI